MWWGIGEKLGGGLDGIECRGSAGGGDYWKSWAAFFRNVVKLNDAVMTVEDCFEMLATSEGIGDVPRTSHRRLIG